MRVKVGSETAPMQIGSKTKTLNKFPLIRYLIVKQLKIAVVVGGISQLKQERHLKKQPEIVVATPGRLVQLIEEVFLIFILLILRRLNFLYIKREMNT